MSVVRAKHGSYTLQGNNTVESIALDKPKEQFRKLWIWPGKYNSATKKLDANGASVFLGRDGDGPQCTPDELGTADPAYPIELPANANETMLLKDVLIQGTAGDSIFYTYWP